MLILGVNAYHGDAAACLLDDGRIIAAAEEERFRRVKHWAGFPSEAIRYCLAAAGAGLRDVGHVAINSDPHVNMVSKIAFTLRRRPDPRLLLDRLRNGSKRASIVQSLEQSFPGESFGGKVHRVEHHLAHLASAFLVSPFKRAVALSVDGFGDFSSAAWGMGRGEALSVDGRVLFPHSLGVFYQALTQYLGFPHYGDEYKVMGLAPYGEPRYMEDMRRIVLLQQDGSFALDTSYFRHHRENVAYQWDGGSPSVGPLYSRALCDLLGPERGGKEPLEQRHRDIARSVQGMYEEAFFHLLRKLHGAYGEDAIALAGGCAMNSVANGKIRRLTPFDRVYIQSAAGDAGGAIGAASHVWRQVNRGKDVPRFVMDHAYWGPAFDDAAIAMLLDSHSTELRRQSCAWERAADQEQLCRRMAEAVSQGLVVGWFQGRMEWGPRALGARSILCDPRRADMKDILNLKIKRRESFRPFAPSVLREAVAEWFEEENDVPFMMQVFQIREGKRSLVPAVTHVDGSGRLQTVHRETNPLYYRLIEIFNQITGVPMVLNTSFNENEPVVCRPDEALNCFLRTKMDLLALGNWSLKRE
jgi:carbamoyltransferase